MSEEKVEKQQEKDEEKDEGKLEVKLQEKLEQRKSDQEKLKEEENEKKLEEEQENKYAEWLSKFECPYEVKELWIPNAYNNIDHLLKDITVEGALKLLRKPANEQFDSRLKLVTLPETYPVFALHGQKGVEAVDTIKEFECLAIYEGKFVHRKKIPIEAVPYIMNLVSDECIPGDPVWDDPLTGSRMWNVLYKVDPTGSRGNISRFVNDFRSHPQTTHPKNTEFVPCMTDQGYPVMLLVSTKQILKGETILTDYGEDYWKY